MTSNFKNSLSIVNNTISKKKMMGLPTDLYKELLKYHTEETIYLPQPVDLSIYRRANSKREAA